MTIYRGACGGWCGCGGGGGGVCGGGGWEFGSASADPFGVVVVWGVWGDVVRGADTSI